MYHLRSDNYVGNIKYGVFLSDMINMGHTSTKKLFVVYLNSNLPGHPVFLFSKYSNPR